MCGEALSGQLHVGAIAAENLNLAIPSTRVEGACASGSLALREGLHAIESGQAEIVMVNGVEKMTDVSTAQATTSLMGAGSEEWEEFQGATFPGLYALMARAYMDKYNLSRETLAKVSVKSHFHGTLNPIAQFKREITIDQVVNSPLVADPLTLLDCSPITDGAASLILCRKDLAKKYSDSPVYVVGSGQASDTLALHGRQTLTGMQGTIDAAQAAFKQAGVSIKEIDISEVHDCFSIAEIMALEGLGLAEPGKAAQLIEDNQTYFDGKTPVNTCGGLKACGHPIGATGVKQAIEVVHQLRNEAGKRQVSNANLGLTHNVGGTGATVVVNIFKR
jgi:acetyl-CoA C-acetyltransferase